MLGGSLLRRSEKPLTIAYTSIRDVKVQNANFTGRFQLSGAPLCRTDSPKDRITLSAITFITVSHSYIRTFFSLQRQIEHCIVSSLSFVNDPLSGVFRNLKAGHPSPSPPYFHPSPLPSFPVPLFPSSPPLPYLRC